MGPDTTVAIECLLTDMALLPGATLCCATDVNRAANRHAAHHAQLAAGAGVVFERSRPPDLLTGTMSSKRSTQRASLHQADESELKPEGSDRGPIRHKLYRYEYENHRGDSEEPTTSCSYVSLVLHVAIGSQVSALPSNCGLLAFAASANHANCIFLAELRRRGIIIWLPHLGTPQQRVVLAMLACCCAWFRSRTRPPLRRRPAWARPVATRAEGDGGDGRRILAPARGSGRRPRCDAPAVGRHQPDDANLPGRDGEVSPP
jgi:hypothetical protein